jgi:hypothetical protein
MRRHKRGTVHHQQDFFRTRLDGSDTGRSWRGLAWFDRQNLPGIRIGQRRLGTNQGTNQGKNH